LATETDFLDLYRKLGVSPGCDLVVFKQAYRRHVSQLHPDRQVEKPGGGDTETLQRLIAQYGAAMEFQRRHGRLPGAPTPSRFVANGGAVRTPRFPPPAQVIAPRHARSKLLVLLSVVAVGILLWRIASLSPPGHAPSAATEGDTSSSSDEESTPMLTLGMSEANVRAIEGEPPIVHEDRWDYGPSWVRFEDGEVVDWYSSPLHSLRTDSSRPARSRQ
jgi:hypothetical protein